MLKNMLKKFFLTLSFVGAGLSVFGQDLKYPIPVESYGDSQLTSIQAVIENRVAVDPFNLIVAIVFFLALFHTFTSSFIHKFGEKLYKKEVERKQQDGKLAGPKPLPSVAVSSLLLLGEIELVFAFWALVLAVLFAVFKDWGTFVFYLENEVNFTEPFFVLVIMAICSTRPITYFTEKMVARGAKIFTPIFKTQSGANWWSILFLGSLLGSFITEPAAITISSYLLIASFFPYTHNTRLKYFTFAVLLLNISLGGTLTHFAAPPIFLVAERWGLSTVYVFTHLGIKSILVLFITTSAGLLLFYKEFKKIDRERAANPEKVSEKKPTPYWVVLAHLLFIVWTVVNAHNMVLFVAGFFIFIGFLKATERHQHKLDLRSPLLICLFLSGLVIHGGLQTWWLEPIVKSLTGLESFFAAAFLTSFYDNAAVTYLSSLIPSFPLELRYNILAGALAGGGLTVVANAPNLTGYSLLSPYFPGKSISHLKLLLYAIFPLVVSCIVYILWR